MHNVRLYSMYFIVGSLVGIYEASLVATTVSRSSQARKSAEVLVGPRSTETQSVSVTPPASAPSSANARVKVLPTKEDQAKPRITATPPDPTWLEDAVQRIGGCLIYTARCCAICVGIRQNPGEPS